MFLGEQKTLLPRDLLFSLFSITCFKGTRKVYTTEKNYAQKITTKYSCTNFSDLISNNSNTLKEFISNNSTKLFKVHINQLLKLLTYIELDLLPNNSKNICLMLKLSESYYQTLPQTLFRICIA